MTHGESREAERCKRPILKSGVVTTIRERGNESVAGFRTKLRSQGKWIGSNAICHFGGASAYSHEG